MSIIDEIGQMQQQGVPDEQIIANLQERGYSPKQINDAISQIQIKSAVGNETPTQEYYPTGQQEQYGGGQQQYSSQQGSTDTLIEIAEQVFNEKISKIQGEIDKLNQFRTIAQGKIDAMSESLRKIEATIDQLQIAILKKVSSYGNSIEEIKDEMSMMQDSFKKVVEEKVSRRISKE